MRNDNPVGDLNRIQIMICIDMSLQLDRGSRTIMSIIVNRSTSLSRTFEVLQLFEAASLSFAAKPGQGCIELALLWDCLNHFPTHCKMN